MRIFFWNIKRNITSDLFKAIGDEVDPEIVLLAESGVSPAEILINLNATNVRYCFNPDPVCDKVLMFSKFESHRVIPIAGNDRYTVRKVEVPGYECFNLMALHYPSKLYSDSVDQSAEAPLYANAIRGFEDRVGHERTILIGDFNMNPFEPGMIQASGFHAVMSQKVALTGSRIIGGRKYPFFYNPMWRFFANNGKETINGTYYRNTAKQVNYFWNIFDQVLIRPEMIRYLNDNSVEILTKIGPDYSLVTISGKIDTAVSDHLPIILTLKPL